MIDSAFELPGTRFRFGLNSIIGLGTVKANSFGRFAGNFLLIRIGQAKRIRQFYRFSSPKISYVTPIYVWLDSAPATDDSATNEVLDEKQVAERTFYRSLLALPYAEVSSFCTFLGENTPFSTHHGVKGDEFDTVFVVLDDSGARWSLYSFDKYLNGEDEANGADRFRRTRNLFYVCCSRAKRNLAVVDLGAGTPAKDARINALFGAGNCFL